MDFLHKLIRRPSEPIEPEAIKRMRLTSSDPLHPIPCANDGDEASGWPPSSNDGPDKQEFRVEAEALAKDRESRNVGNPFLSLPEGFLEGVFLELGLSDLAKCKRICRACDRMLRSSAPLLLHFELLSSSLSAPLTSRTTTSSRVLLTTLRERRDRMRTFDPSFSFRVKLDPDEGRLYEYLEGHLLRGNGLSTSPPPNMNAWVDMQIAEGGEGNQGQEVMEEIINHIRRMPHGATVYDLGEGVDEWEDEEAPTQTLHEMIAASTSRRGHPGSSASGAAIPGAHTGMTVEEAAEQDEMVIAVEDDDPDMYSKRKWSSDFEVKDVAMDPGQDLFVAAEMSREAGDRPWKLHLHMLSLSTFTTHPSCKLREGKLESITSQTRRRANLVIQICDDKVFVFVSRWATTVPGANGGDAEGHPAGSPPETTLVAFEWTTGQMLFEIVHEPPRDRTHGFTIMEDFILLSDRTFGVVTYSAPAGAMSNNSLVTAFDVHTLVPNPDWTEVVAGAEDNGDPSAKLGTSLRLPRHKVQPVARLILPALRNVVSITARADPPPRAFFPKFKPLAVYPSPNTGIIVISFDTHDFNPMPDLLPTFYTLFLRKETVYEHVPYLDVDTGGLLSGLTDRLLASLPQTVPLEQLAPHCRFMSHIEMQDWVCHTYHYRFVCGIESPSMISRSRLRDCKRLRILNFDPIEVRKVICERRALIAEERGIEPAEVSDELLEAYDDEDSRGIRLHMTPERVGGEPGEMLPTALITGSEMPYTSVWDDRVRPAQGMMIDDSRVVLISERQANGSAAGLEVLNF